MTNQGRTIAGFLAGAGLMYLMDPDRGSRRRELLRDHAVRARHRVTESAEATSRDLRNRARGTAAELRAHLHWEVPADEILHERVRSALRRVVSHPGAVTVSVADGQVTLQGRVLAHELDELAHTVAAVRGVSDVRNELVVDSSAEGVPSLQGASQGDKGAPTTRLGAGMIGGIALYRGLRSEGVARPVLVGLGGMLLLRALTAPRGRRLTGMRGLGTVDIRKTIRVNAPVERVWEVWNDFESWPRFMSHLKEVRRTGADRSHWVAKGPGGAGVEWDAVTTQAIPNEVIAWKSVEGSTIEHSGRVYFSSDERGGTLIEIRMSYSPPAGGVGHTVASLLGVDPGSAMDEDMVRLKSLLEEGKTTADRGQVRLEDLPGSRPLEGS